LQQVSWCPTRSGILASISRDENCVKLWDIKDNTASTLDALMYESVADPMRRMQDIEVGGSSSLGLAADDVLEQTKSKLLQQFGGVDDDGESESLKKPKPGSEPSIALNKPVKGMQQDECLL
jgi:hypothetical protein